jgi:hypothetical protein
MVNPSGAEVIPPKRIDQAILGERVKVSLGRPQPTRIFAEIIGAQLIICHRVGCPAAGDRRRRVVQHRAHHPLYRKAQRPVRYVTPAPCADIPGWRSLAHPPLHTGLWVRRMATYPPLWGRVLALSEMA